jgi:UDP-N-acetylglucosamine 2-epimerase (non-hydrolysing)
LNITTIVGTRPEAIKMAPVLLALARHAAMTSTLIATGQHGTLFHDALTPFGLTADRWLEAPTAGLAPDAMAEAIMTRLIPLLREERPDLVLVQGDTTSALAAAKAAARCEIPVGHVEAGLRSHDLERPWPEEGNRIAIDHLATLLFAPTEANIANLNADPLVKGKVFLTGNTGIDALLHVRRTLPPPAYRKHILVTLHRRETIGDPLCRICEMLAQLVTERDVFITLPLHPNPNVRDIVTGLLSGRDRISLIEPLSYPEMIAAMTSSDLILSDSGGIQEEAPALGVPLLILRDVTERPEAVACGGAALTGTDPGAIRAETIRLLDDPAARAAMAIPRFPFGRGDAANKVITVIENYLRSQNVT